MIHFELFYHLDFQIRQLKQYILGIDPRKDNHPGPFPQYKAFVLLLHFFANLRRAERCLADGVKGFFGLPSRGSPNFAFHELTCSRLNLLTVVRTTSSGCLFCT